MVEKRNASSMVLRVDVMQLPSTPAYKIQLDCVAWKLRLNRITLDKELVIDGTDIRESLMSGMFIDGDLVPFGWVELDFPPVYDAEGRPVFYTQVLKFGAVSGAVFHGSLIQVRMVQVA